MAGQIEHATDEEPAPTPWTTGGRLARKYEYMMFYFFAISSWCLEIAAAALGSLYGGDDRLFIATITPFLVTHWYVTQFACLLPSAQRLYHLLFD